LKQEQPLQAPSTEGDNTLSEAGSKKKKRNRNKKNRMKKRKMAAAMNSEGTSPQHE
jgi:hypothetical protein